MHLALYQPDIPQNTGTILRLAACLGVQTHIIGPAGFDMSGRALRRSGLDYLGHAVIHRHTGFDEFERWRNDHGLRLVAVTSRGKTPYINFAFSRADILLMGRESAGLPSTLLDTLSVKVRIQMKTELRSLNIAVAAAMVLGEALRQTGGFEGLA